MRSIPSTAAFAAALVITTMVIFPAQAQSQGQQASPKREAIYGYKFMSAQERDEYRQKMQGAASTQERQAIRDEHRKTMEARMREQGMEHGQMRGRGAGPQHSGMGMGMGSGPGIAGQSGPTGPRGPGARGTGNGSARTPAEGGPSEPPKQEGAQG